MFREASIRRMNNNNNNNNKNVNHTMKNKSVPKTMKSTRNVHTHHNNHNNPFDSRTNTAAAVVCTPTIPMTSPMDPTTTSVVEKKLSFTTLYDQIISLGQQKEFDIMYQLLIEEYAYIQSKKVHLTTSTTTVVPTSGDVVPSVVSQQQGSPTCSNSSRNGNTNNETNNVSSLHQRREQQGEMMMIQSSNGTSRRENILIQQQQSKQEQQQHSSSSIRRVMFRSFRHLSTKDMTTTTSSSNSKINHQNRRCSQRPSVSSTCSSRVSKSKRRATLPLTALHDILAYCPPFPVVDVLCTLLREQQQYVSGTYNSGGHNHCDVNNHNSNQSNDNDNDIDGNITNHQIHHHYRCPEDVEDQFCRKPLHIAVMHGCDILVIKRLLKGTSYLLPVMAVDEDGRTPLHWACDYNNTMKMSSNNITTTADDDDDDSNRILSTNDTDKKLKSKVRFWHHWSVRRALKPTHHSVDMKSNGRSIGEKPTTSPFQYHYDDHYEKNNMNEIVELLLHSYPRASTIKDRYGFIPIDIARRNNQQVHPQIILSLLDAYSKIDEKNKMKLFLNSYNNNNNTMAKGGTGTSSGSGHHHHHKKRTSNLVRDDPYKNKVESSSTTAAGQIVVTNTNPDDSWGQRTITTTTANSNTSNSTSSHTHNNNNTNYNSNHINQTLDNQNIHPAHYRHYLQNHHRQVKSERTLLVQQHQHPITHPLLEQQHCHEYSTSATNTPTTNNNNTNNQNANENQNHNKNCEIEYYYSPSRNARRCRHHHNHHNHNGEHHTRRSNMNILTTPFDIVIVPKKRTTTTTMKKDKSRINVLATDHDNDDGFGICSSSSNTTSITKEDRIDRILREAMENDHEVDENNTDDEHDDEDPDEEDRDDDVSSLGTMKEFKNILVPPHDVCFL